MSSSTKWFTNTVLFLFPVTQTVCSTSMNIRFLIRRLGLESQFYNIISRAVVNHLIFLRLSFFFFFLYINLFIYLFLAVLSLHCHTRAFSGWASGGYSSLQCTSFSLRWLLLLWGTGSRCMGFSSCGTWAQ